MLTLLHELYTVIKCFKIAPNLANSIDYMIEKLFIIFYLSFYEAYSIASERKLSSKSSKELNFSTTSADGISNSKYS